ncbi:MAG: hypothetical protein V1678_00965 [Candidatus Aenigmatarchaeota archaeon]
MKVTLAFFVFLLILAINVQAAPVLSDIADSPASAVQYSPNIKYSFQVTIDGGDYRITEVLFESNFNGTLANMSSSNKSGKYYVNFTGLPAGDYAYRWHASDNQSNWSSTDQQSYSVSKNNTVNIRLFLNGTESNKSYKINAIANLTAFIGLAKTVYINSNYPGFALQYNSSKASSLVNLSSPGIFSATAYWEGDQNYSSSNKTLYFDSRPPQYSDLAENPAGGANYYPGRYYNFSVKWTDVKLSQVWFESNHTGTLRNYTFTTKPSVQNSSDYFYISLYDLPATKNFAYRWMASDDANQQNNTSKTYYNIFKANPLSLQVFPSDRVVNGTQTTIRCLSITPEVPLSNFKLYRGSTLINNDTTFSRKDVQTLDAGTYYYECKSSATQNFTNQTIKQNLTVLAQLDNYLGIIGIDGQSKLASIQGGSLKSTFLLMNNLNSSIDILSFTISGIDSEWFIVPELPSSIPNNFSMQIIIRFNIPDDAAVGDYPINLRAAVRHMNQTKIVTKDVVLSVTLPEEVPPQYSSDAVNTTVYAQVCEFALRWDSQIGLSGFVFSSNSSGTWINETWKSFQGNGISHAYQNLSVVPGSVVAWKFFCKRLEQRLVRIKGI